MEFHNKFHNKYHENASNDFDKFQKCLQDKSISPNIKAKIIKDHMKENYITYSLKPKPYHYFIQALKNSSFERQLFTVINVEGDQRILAFLKFLEKEEYISLIKVDVEAAKQPNYKDTLTENYWKMVKAQNRVNIRTGLDHFAIHTPCMQKQHHSAEDEEHWRRMYNMYTVIDLMLYDLERNPKLFENIYIISWKQYIYLTPSLEDTIPQGLSQLYVSSLGEERNEGFEFLDKCLFVDELVRFKHPYFFIVYDEISNCFLTLDKALKIPDFVESYIYAINWHTHENGYPIFVNVPKSYERFYGACTLGKKKINILEQYTPRHNYFSKPLSFRNSVITERILKAHKEKKLKNYEESKKQDEKLIKERAAKREEYKKKMNEKMNALINSEEYKKKIKEDEEANERVLKKLKEIEYQQIKSIGRITEEEREKRREALRKQEAKRLNLFRMQEEEEKEN